MDLFTPKVPVEKQHPNFRAITEPGMCEGECAVLQSWADGFPDRDGKFVEQFQTTFNSSFWELYLNAAFRELGFTPDFTYESPDFILSGPYDLICEATVAEHPQGFVPEWEREISKEALKQADPSAIVELASIRLANAIDAKQRKFLKSYGAMDHVRGKPFVIAVAPYEQPFFYFQSDQAIRRVLYGYDQPLWIEHPVTKERVVVGESLVDQVRKHTGATIEMGLFARPGLEHVSAVIFSPVATFGKVRALTPSGPYPVIFQAFRYAENEQHKRVVVAQRPEYQERLLDGLHVLVNPFADHPIDLRPFDRPELALHTLDPESGEYMVASHDGFLFFRQAFSMVPREKPGEPMRFGRRGADNYMKYVPATLQDGELVPVPGGVPPALENHLAQHRGWTLLIFLDGVDRDWGGMAVEALCTDLGAFTRFNRQDDVRSIFMPEFYPSKEQAYEALRALIDDTLDDS